MVNNARMVNDKQAPRSGSLTAADWVTEACLAIVEGGVGAVAVEPLAQRLGVTKGSFYWHFSNRDALLQAALERWEEGTEAVIAELGRIADPRLRLEQLIATAFSGYPRDDGVTARGIGAGYAFDGAAALGIGSSHAFQLAISDAADDPIVGPTLRRVSERRVDYLDKCFRALGLTTEEARYRAFLAYAAYVGTLRLAREAPSRLPRNEEYQAYQRHLIAMTMPEGESGSSERDQPPQSASEPPS
jgi:AcrR family transcriptional regulator